MGKVVLCDHPLIQHKLSYIRDENTSSRDFRALVDEVATLMAYEITRDMTLEEIRIQTPVAEAQCRIIAGPGPVLVPVLRAGLGMVDGILKLVPHASVGHIGLYRDEESLLPVEYYVKLPPDSEARELVVIDPMLATGGSANAAIALLKRSGCRRIRLMCLIASPEGVEAVRSGHDDVDIYVAAIDERLNDRGYIVPGLGDAGDRLFGTK